MLMTGKPVDSNSRAKLYLLDDKENWLDQGTGYASISTGDDGVRRLMFEEEGSMKVLHHRPIWPPDKYQIRGESSELLTWEDPENKHKLALTMEIKSATFELYQVLLAARRVLPVPGPKSIGKTSEAVTMFRPGMRETWAKELMQEDVVWGLVHAFRHAEDEEDWVALHHCFKVTKTFFTLGNQALLEHWLKTDLCWETLGMLEYDEGIPLDRRIMHRQVHTMVVNYNDEVKVEDPEIRDRIHFVYRLQYVKDIALPRLLDDSAVASINSMIYSSLGKVLDYFKKTPEVWESLYERLQEGRVNALLFLLEVSRAAKLIPPAQRTGIQGLLGHTLPALLIFLKEVRSVAPESRSGSQEEEVCYSVRPPVRPRALAMEIFTWFVQFAPSVIRQQLAGGNAETGAALLKAMINIMHREEDQGLQNQAFDVIKCSMDVSNANAETKDKIQGIFFNDGFKRICAPLSDLDKFIKNDSLAYGAQLVCDLLTYAVANHGGKTQLFLESAKNDSNLGEPIGWLFHCDPRFLQMAPIRLVRSMILTKEEPFLKFIMKNRLLHPPLKRLRTITSTRFGEGGAIYSSLLSLFDLIAKEKVVTLIEHLVTKETSLMTALKPKCKAIATIMGSFGELNKARVKVAQGTSIPISKSSSSTEIIAALTKSNSKEGLPPPGPQPLAAKRKAAFSAAAASAVKAAKATVASTRESNANVSSSSTAAATTANPTPATVQEGKSAGGSPGRDGDAAAGSSNGHEKPGSDSKVSSRPEPEPEPQHAAATSTTTTTTTRKKTAVEKPAEPTAATESTSSHAATSSTSSADVSLATTDEKHDDVDMPSNPSTQEDDNTGDHRSDMSSSSSTSSSSSSSSDSSDSSSSSTSSTSSTSSSATTRSTVTAAAPVAVATATGAAVVAASVESTATEPITATATTTDAAEMRDAVAAQERIPEASTNMAEEASSAASAAATNDVPVQSAQRLACSEEATTENTVTEAGIATSRVEMAPTATAASAIPTTMTTTTTSTTTSMMMTTTTARNSNPLLQTAAEEAGPEFSFAGLGSAVAAATAAVAAAAAAAAAAEAAAAKPSIQIEAAAAPAAAAEAGEAGSGIDVSSQATAETRLTAAEAALFSNSAPATSNVQDPQDLDVFGGVAVAEEVLEGSEPAEVEPCQTVGAVTNVAPQSNTPVMDAMPATEAAATEGRSDMEAPAPNSLSATSPATEPSLVRTLAYPTPNEVRNGADSPESPRNPESKRTFDEISSSSRRSSRSSSSGSTNGGQKKSQDCPQDGLGLEGEDAEEAEDLEETPIKTVYGTEKYWAGGAIPLVRSNKRPRTS